MLNYTAHVMKKKIGTAVRQFFWSTLRATMVTKSQIALYVCGPVVIVAFVLFGVLYELGVNELLEQRAYVRQNLLKEAK